LPTDVKQTVSQGLAAVEDREIVEAKLWRKVATLCQAAAVPTDDAAPDFVCAASQAPPVGVFRLAHDPQEGQENQSPTGSVLDNIVTGDENVDDPGDDDPFMGATPSWPTGEPIGQRTPKKAKQP